MSVMRMVIQEGWVSVVGMEWVCVEMQEGQAEALVGHEVPPTEPRPWNYLAQNSLAPG